MIQDIWPHQLLNQYDKKAPPRPEDLVFVTDGNRVLMKDGVRFPQVQDLGMELSYQYLFSVDKTGLRQGRSMGS